PSRPLHFPRLHTLRPARNFRLFHRFPLFLRIPPLPQTLSLRQLEPHCVNPATSIRITNTLSLTSINYRAIIVFELGDPLSPMECCGLPPLFPLPAPTSSSPPNLCVRRLRRPVRG